MAKDTKATDKDTGPKPSASRDTKATTDAQSREVVDHATTSDRPRTMDAEPKPLVKEPEPELVKAAGPAQADPMPEQSEMTIEQLLADPRFDPEGRVRHRLAEISAKGPLGQRPPADLVNADGTPVTTPK